MDTLTDSDVAESRLREIVEGLDAIVWEADPFTWRYTFVNCAASKVLGFPIERWTDEPDFRISLVHPEDRDHMVAICREATREGRDHEVEYRAKTADGRVVWLHEVVHVERNEEGRACRLRGVTVEVTETKRLEAQVLEWQKMDALGRILTSVAHELNNEVGAIIGFAEVLHKDLGPDDPRHVHAEEIVKAMKRVDEMTKRILVLGPRQTRPSVEIDLNATLLEMETLLRRIVSGVARLDLALGRSLRRIRVQPGEMEQVLLNLVINSRDAMPYGGTIRLSTGNVLAGERGVPWPSGSPGRECVMLEVSDTGVGMSAATRARLFEPFFSTKAPGKGTGLGLWTVYRIVEQSGGTIAVESEPGKGTSFRVYLPALETPHE